MSPYYRLQWLYKVYDALLNGWLDDGGQVDLPLVLGVVGVVAGLPEHEPAHLLGALPEEESINSSFMDKNDPKNYDKTNVYIRLLRQ